MKKIFAALLCLCLVFSGCQNTGETASGGETTPNITVSITPEDLFSDRDLSGKYDANTVYISLLGQSATCNGNGVSVQGSTVTITKGGTYVLAGALDDGMIIVNADKSEKVQLAFEGASIHSETCAPIYVQQADKVFITLAEGTENSLSNGGSFTPIDESNIDAVIFSREDLTLNGTGTLTVTSPAGHGIVSKDELTIASGSYTVSCASHGLSGKDSIAIADGSFVINAGKDGIQADNDEDTTLGFVYITGGSFLIDAQGDGISASTDLQIDGGSFTITTGGGSANAKKQTSDSWGGYPGGMGRPGQSTTQTTTEDSTSIKALKAGVNLVVSGGTFHIDAADDAVHANGNVSVSGGVFQIATGDDGFHADDTLTITDGEITITESYEGLEGLHVAISGGKINLRASDDGINAAGGTDQSGMGGFRGDDQFGGRGGMGGGPGGMGGMSAGNGSITISGGEIAIYAEGDGIDANGTLSITDGFVQVCGPTVGDTATLDYDTSATITGGTFIGTGASGMAQTFSDSTQGVFAISTGGSITAGSQIVITDQNGNVMLSYSPEASFAVVIFSSPEMVKGQTYTITIGELSGSFEAQ